MSNKIFYLLPFFLQSLLIKLSDIFYNQKIVDDFINNDEYGKYYNIKSKHKKKILKRLLISLSSVKSATSLQAQLTLIMQILKKNIVGVLLSVDPLKVLLQSHSQLFAR
jgi:hypothetical protein